MTAKIIHIHELEDELAFSNLAEIYFTREGEVVAASPLALKLLGYQSYELRELYLVQLMPQALRLLDVCHYQALAEKPVVFARKQGGRFAAKVQHKQRDVSFPGEVLTLQAMQVQPLQPGAELQQKIRSHLSAQLPRKNLDALATLTQSSQSLQQSLSRQTGVALATDEFCASQLAWRQDLEDLAQQMPQHQSCQRVFNLPLSLALWQQSQVQNLALILADGCAEVVLAEQDKLLSLLTQLHQHLGYGEVQLLLKPHANGTYCRFELSVLQLDEERQKECMARLSHFQQCDAFLQLGSSNDELLLDGALKFSFDYLLMPVIHGRSMDCMRNKRVLLLDAQAQVYAPQLQYWGADCVVGAVADKSQFDLLISAKPGLDSYQADYLQLDDSQSLVALANQLCALYQQAPLWQYSQGAMARSQQSQCLAQQNAVLLVSDNLDFSQAIQALVEQDNCYLVCAMNALDAILAVQEMAYQAIILDCQLESMPAFETLVHMRSNALLNRHCQVFAVSQDTSPNVRLGAAEVGLKHIYQQQQLNLLGTDLHRYLIDAEQAQLDLDLLDLHQDLAQLQLKKVLLNVDVLANFLNAWGADSLRRFSSAALAQLGLGLQLWRQASHKQVTAGAPIEAEQVLLLQQYLLDVANCVGFSAVAECLAQTFEGGDNFAQRQLQQVLLQQSLEQSQRALWFEFGLSC